MGGVCVARGQYSSLGERAAGVSLGAVQREEGVQVIVQVECGREEVDKGEKHGERQNEDTSNRQSTAHHGWREDGMIALLQTLEPCSVIAHHLRGVNCIRKMTCEVYVSTHPVGYSGSPSTVNETNCNKKESKTIL